MRPSSRLAAAGTTAALALAACSGGGGGGGDLPSDPAAAVSEAAANTAENGFTVSLDAELSDAAREQAVAEGGEDAERFLSLLGNEPLRLTVDEDDHFAMTFNDEGGTLVQLRFVEQGFYLQADVEPLVERFGGSADEVSQVRSQIEQFGGAGGGPFADIATLGTALFDGRWVGITDLPEDVGEQLQNLGGQQTDPEAAEEKAEELGFRDPQAFIENYVEVTGGEDGRYEAQLDAQALVDAFGEFSQAAGQALPTGEIPEDVPETVGPVTITTEDDRLSGIEADFFRLAESMASEEELADLQDDGIGEGDVILKIGITEADPVEIPGDAETIQWSTVESLLQQFLGGFGGNASANAG